MVSAVTEGEEKPAKYPLMFRACELVLINKIDLLPHLDFDLDKFLHHLDAVHPGRGAHHGQRQDRRGHRPVARLADAGGRARRGEGARVTRSARQRRRSTGARRADAGERELLRGRGERLARLCHRMAERFARGGRLVALGRTPAARSDARHVAVEFVHPVIVGKRALPALALAGEGGPLGAQIELAAEPDDIVIAFGAGQDGGEAAAALAGRPRARLPDAGLRARRRRVGVRAARLRPLDPPGAGGDALPRALGAGATCSSTTAACSRAARRARCTTPAPRASSIRSWARASTISRP